MGESMSIAVVGATGLVGQEMVSILQNDPKFSKAKILKVAQTERPESGVLSFKSAKNEISDCNFILNATGEDVAQTLAEGLKKNQILIDNSSAFRLDPGVPLVVPEINGDLLQSNPSIVANPNCTAILLCLSLAPLQGVGFSRVIVSTYQAASGAGIKGLGELEDQIKALSMGQKLQGGEVFKFPLAGNVLSHNTAIRPEGEIGSGYNEEEWKVIEETRKILNLRSLPISVTSIRVPVKRAHTESVTVDLKQDIGLSEIRGFFKSAPGLKVVDDWQKNHFPMPFEAEGKDEVFVGRFRKDVSLGKTLHFMLAGDQIRKGAALNAVQILKAHLNLIASLSN